MEPLRRKISDILATALSGLAYLCIRRGLRFQDIIDPLKSAFIQAAHFELERISKDPNKSRLAAMTGLQRKDVERLLKGEPPKSDSISFFSKLISTWTSDKKFSTNGKPRILKCEGSNSEFASLVASISTDMNSYTVLFELERMAMVKKEGDSVKLIYDIYLVSENELDGLEIMSKDIKDLTIAVSQNILKESPIPNLHISTRYDNLSVNKIELIREWLLREGAMFHSRARDFIQKYDKDINPDLKDDVGGGTVVLGAFSKTTFPKLENTENEDN